MKHIFFLALLIGIFSGCQPDPEQVLQRAQKALAESNYISYNYISLWPLPIGITDTLAGKGEFVRNESAPFGYDYISLSPGKSDAVFHNQEYKIINHEEQTVTVYTSQDFENGDGDLTMNLSTSFSPISFLQSEDWVYVKDTIIGEERLLDYFLVENDTTFEGKKVYAERHIFINPSDYLLTRFERRNYYDGEMNQKITYEFNGYIMESEPRELVYNHPENYISKLYRDREKLALLKAGERAPEFELLDMDGNTVRLADFKGQKLLLNFSMIRCGACKMAMDQFTEDGFQLAGDRKLIYVNPVDNVEEMKVYLSNYKVDFPVLLGAKETGKAYGVSGYPIFFLVDEQGVVEEVFPGYHKDFFNRLREGEGLG